MAVREEAAVRELVAVREEATVTELVAVIKRSGSSKRVGGSN